MAWTAAPGRAPGRRGRGRSRRMTSSCIARITGDRNPLHFDEAFAAATKAGRLIVHGGLTTGLFNALVAMELPGPGLRVPPPGVGLPGAGPRRRHRHRRGRGHRGPRSDKPITRLRCVARRDDGTEVLRGECLVYTMRPE